MKFLTRELLTLHGTYTASEIDAIEELKQSAKEKGTQSFTFDEKVSLANYLELTGYKLVKTKLQYPSEREPRMILDFRWDKKCNEFIDPCLEEIVSEINSDSISKISQVVGYTYSPHGGVNPGRLNIGQLEGKFLITDKHKFIDVGCGYGLQGIDAFLHNGCETVLLDSNAVNIRNVYLNLLEYGLLGNPKIKVNLSTVQNSGLQQKSFDRAFLGSTTELESNKIVSEILKSTVGLMKDKSKILISNCLYKYDYRSILASFILKKEYSLRSYYGCQINLINLNRK